MGNRPSEPVPSPKPSASSATAGDVDVPRLRNADTTVTLTDSAAEATLNVVDATTGQTVTVALDDEGMETVGDLVPMIERESSGRPRARTIL